MLATIYADWPDQVSVARSNLSERVGASVGLFAKFAPVGDYEYPAAVSKSEDGFAGEWHELVLERPPTTNAVVYDTGRYVEGPDCSRVWEPRVTTQSVVWAHDAFGSYSNQVVGLVRFAKGLNVGSVTGVWEVPFTPIGNHAVQVIRTDNSWELSRTCEGTTWQDFQETVDRHERESWTRIETIVNNTRREIRNAVWVYEWEFPELP